MRFFAANTVSQPRRVAVRRLSAIVLMLVAVLCAGCGQQRKPVNVSGPAQGTTYNVTVTRPPGDVDTDSVRKAMRDVIDRIDRQMSSWRDDSELSRFNAAPAGQWVSVSPQLAELVRSGLAIGQRTGGAFDITIGAILNMWGFGPEGDHPSRLPNTDEVNAARENTGLGLVDVRTDPPALRKKRDGVIVDVAGLAQGYTVDRMAKRLSDMGAEHYLVELGGELFARGTKADGQAWRIGVEKPEAGVRSIDRVIDIKNAGMTTSGDYRDFFELDGHRFSHTIDPRTGRPVAHDLRAVTVIAQDAMTADAMATALLVMGPKAGMAYANDHDIAALFVSGNEGAYTKAHSKALGPYLKEAK